MKHSLILKKVSVHNLQQIDIELNPEELIVFTGVSGSGKSSLAFDTIYIEGQRRYVESLSTFARRHMGEMTKPDVERVEGLTPTISIEQKSAGRNPRSTVGTMTEVYDYLRVLFARIATPYCPVSREPVLAQSKERITSRVHAMGNGKRFILLAPIARHKKGEFTDDLKQLVKKGFLRARIDGRIVTLDEDISLDKSQFHDIDIVIDRLSNDPENASRIAEGIAQALEIGQGVMSVLDDKSEEETLFSMHAYSPQSGLSYPPLEPGDFSFNSPNGMCPTCHGLGTTLQFDLSKIIDPEKSISQDCCLVASSYDTVRYKNIYDNLLDVDTPWKNLSEKAKKVFLYGNNQKWTRIDFVHPTRPIQWTDYIQWRGVLHEAKERYLKAKSASYKKKMQQYLSEQICDGCRGSRLKPYPSAARLDNKTIQELSGHTIGDLNEFLDKLSLRPRLLPNCLYERKRGCEIQDERRSQGEDTLVRSEAQEFTTAASSEGREGSNLGLRGEEALIGTELIKEIKQRLSFLIEVGLHYLSLDRISPTLSGGEAQRVRLASQIGSGLVGVTYVLDEPSIGLHPRDNTRLVKTLEHLRDKGNTVIVVEHDEETILAADTIVDFGPGAGSLGGTIVAKGSVEDLIKAPQSITGAFLSGRETIAIPKKRRKVSTENAIWVKGAAQNNLKEIDVPIPLGAFVAVTGVSGSGKSSLVTEILYPALSNALHRGEHVVGKMKRLEGADLIDKVIAIDQSPIGRNPRSNPATFVKLFDEIRDLFSQLPESQARGFKPGRFSFNVKEGSCLHCHGMGMIRIDMDFMEDQWVVCPVCNNRRFDSLTLGITYKGKNISQVLDMTIKEAHAFFLAIPFLSHKLHVLERVGLDYLTLGQPSPTLSGGEAQRIKLAKELMRPSTGKTLYILDEPTTGLHFADIRQLLTLLHELVDRGNSVLTIEHNVDVIKTADWIIDLGPEGGRMGGYLIGTGTPQEIAKQGTPTGQALKKALAGPLTISAKKAKQKKVSATDSITVKGAAQHNLKNVDATIPRGAITVCTGPSGSGKSSFAFDTIYAEGQRRYIESLSPYARQFVEQMPKSQVEEIDGLSPAVAIEQKAHAGNPRSTVGTLTEVYDFLRILFARSGIPHCPETKEVIRSISKERVVEKLLTWQNSAITLLAPIEWQRGGDFHALLQEFQKQGFLRLRINKTLYELDEENIPFDPKRKNQIELVVDRLKITSSMRTRLLEAVELASSIANGKILVLKGDEEQLFNLRFAVESTGKSYPPITPHTFAFNVKEGMCLECQGLGYLYGANVSEMEEFLQLTVKGVIATLFGFAGKKRLSSSEQMTWELTLQFLTKEGIDPNALLEELPNEKLHILMNGSDKWCEASKLHFRWIGINNLFAKAGRSAHTPIREALMPLLQEVTCYSCEGTRINPLARNVTIDGQSIADICRLPINRALEWVKKHESHDPVLDEVMTQLKNRFTFMNRMGLHYLSCDRSAPTLSNGEAQRIRLARQLGSGLTGVLYVLDEPTIGLHPDDNQLLNQALLHLKELGNTLLLVEHDPLTIQIADYILDFGPKAGLEGGEIVARGRFDQIIKNPKSVTGPYLSGKKKIPVPKKRRSSFQTLDIVKACDNNLKKLSVSFPIGALSCITGVSGSGKSTLMHQVIAKAAKEYLSQNHPKENEHVKGLESIEKLICVDQNPIGRTVRSDVSTYVDALDKMRSFFASLPEARVRGLKARHFSTNHKRGMCTHCQGLGYRKIYLQFLPPVTVVCEECRGLRLNKLSLTVTYQSLNLGQILQMTVTEALKLFEKHPRIQRILSTLCDVGLDYLKLGQEIVTLSGGEAQRIKLARELAKRSSLATLYLLDEPTNGLHPTDIAKLLDILHKLADKGHTIIVIEHNCDVIKNCDFVCDLGPEAGDKGGYLVAKGTPEEIASNKKSKTGKYLIKKG